MKTSALFTDLYELTMVQEYAAEQMDQLAVFELAFREMPRRRNYIVAAGLGDVLHFSRLSALRTRRIGLLAPNPCVLGRVPRPVEGPSVPWRCLRVAGRHPGLSKRAPGSGDCSDSGSTTDGNVHLESDALSEPCGRQGGAGGRSRQRPQRRGSRLTARP